MTYIFLLKKVSVFFQLTKIFFSIYVVYNYLSERWITSRPTSYVSRFLTTNIMIINIALNYTLIFIRFLLFFQFLILSIIRQGRLYSRVNLRQIQLLTNIHRTRKRSMQLLPIRPATSLDQESTRKSLNRASNLKLKQIDSVRNL